MKCLKSKVESSGFPQNCNTDEQKQVYVDEQNAVYNFDLKVSEVVKNAAKRTLAKTNLNQFWGRYGMRMNKMCGNREIQVKSLVIFETKLRIPMVPVIIFQNFFVVDLKVTVFKCPMEKKK